MSKLNAAYTLILLLVAGIAQASAQERGHREWWARHYQEVPADGHPYASRAQQIFGRIKPLAEARAERDPALLILKDLGQTTVIAIDDGTIILPLEAVSLCYRNRTTREGDDLLAFVLGHELSHLSSDEFQHLEAFYARERHVTDPAARKRLDEIDPRRRRMDRESEADDQGLVLMTMAGFDPRNVVAAGPEFFESWVQSAPYQFSGESGVYPAPAERAAYVSARLRDTADKLEFFDLGVRYYELGAYDDAISLFEIFARQFPERAVLNNLGLSHFQSAMGVLAACDSQLVLRFRLPVLLDPGTLARAVKRGTASECYRLPTFVQHKKLAAEYFERVIRTNPDYYPAYINLASLRILSNDGAGALGAADQLLQRQPDHVEGQGLKAIAIHLYDEEDQFLDTGQAGLLMLRRLNEQHPSSAALTYNRARLELEAHGPAAAKQFWEAYLELDPAGAYAGFARAQSGTGGIEASGETWRGPPSPPLSPNPPGEELKPWLEGIDPAPLKIDSGRLQGQLHRGDRLRVFVVNRRIVLIERKVKEPLHKQGVFERYGPPRRSLDTTQGEFLDYDQFGFDMISGRTHTIVFFPNGR